MKDKIKKNQFKIKVRYATLVDLAFLGLKIV